MKKSLRFTTVGLVVCVFLLAPASAKIVVEEQFDYEILNPDGVDTQTPLNGLDGGVGFDGAWSATQSHGRLLRVGLLIFANGEPITLNDDRGLHFTAAGGAELPVAGAAVSRYGAAGRTQADRLLSAASQAALTQDNTTIWFSVLAGGSSQHTNAFFLFGTDRLIHTFDGGSGIGMIDAPGQGFGFNLTGPVNALVYDNSVDAIIVPGTYSQTLQAGATHYDTSLLVGKINWKPNGTPDEFFLFNVTDLSVEPSESEAIVSVTDRDMDQSAFDTVTYADGAWAVIDEIRFGTTFAHVMGATNAASNPDPPDGSRVPPDGDEGDGHWMLLEFTAGYDATAHTAYFSSNFDDVNDRNPAVSLGSPPYPGVYPTGYYVGLDDSGLPEFARTPLESDKIYYWAVDESNGTSTSPGDVWSFKIASKKAWDPTPADGAQYVSAAGVALSWQPGAISNPDDYTISYNVYWGTEMASVESGTSETTNVSDLAHTIGPLSYETEYYWKVDTVLVRIVPPFDTTVVEGTVWRFTTGLKGAGYILREVWEGIAGTAVSDLTSDPRYPGSPDSSELLTSFEGPTDVLDTYGSRLHGWLLVAQSGYYTFWIATDDNGELWLSTNESVGNAVLISWVGDFAGGGWAAARQFDDPDVVPSDPIYLEGGKKYYIAGLMKEGNGGDNIAVAWKGPDSGDVREVIPGNHLMPYVQRTAEGPKPANGATDVSRTPTLEWSPGVFAAATSGNILYYGSDAGAVANRTATSVTLTNPIYALPLTLDLGQTFYWAVDTVNGAETWPGDVWSFKVGDWLAVDDMESYTPWNVAGDNIFEAWRDGMGNCNPGNGNDTGSNLVENTVLTYVFEGLQSMQYDYDNDGMVYNPCGAGEDGPRSHNYSKIEAQIAGLSSGIGTDWTTEGVKALSLRFYGLSTNGIEPMWVQLSDGAKAIGSKVTYGDYEDENPADIAKEQWHEWFIDMADFGVEPTGLVSISIGFGNEDGSGAQGSGTVYFDDIRLYTPRCMPSRRSEAMAKVDFAPLNAPDCVVNHKEVEIMARNWLGVVPVMTPITVPDASFDNYVLTEGAYIDVNDPGYTGPWVCDSNNSWIDYGYWRADGYPEDLYAHSGNNKAYAYEDYLYQILDSTFIEGQTYTLQAWVGQPWVGYASGWRLYLTDNDYTNNLIEASGTAGLDWEQISLAYTATAADAGKKIGIKMWSNEEVSIDDVTLFRSSEALTADLRVNLYDDGKIDFKDFAELTDKYLDEDLFP